MVVLAAKVAGGVVTSQIALTFFLLPHAVLAHPVYTARFPRFAADAAAGRLDALANDVRDGVRSMAFLLAPAAALLAALAEPGLRFVRLGALDNDGARLAAGVLAAMAAGLVGFSASFLLTRAAYALDDVRSPTFVAVGCAAAGVVAMAVASASVDGDTRVVVLGAVLAVVHTLTALLLLRAVAARLPEPILPTADVVRSVGAAVVAGLASVGVVAVVDGGGRGGAAAALAAGGVVGIGVYAASHRLTGGSLRT
jgi:putative peptidoglycan lipid II flippase